MRTRARMTVALLGVGAVAALAVTGAAAAGAAQAAPTPCTTSLVSFYFGGHFAGLGRRSFDVTLLAHDGVTCALSDTPLVTVAGPPGQTATIPLHVDGRGGTLVLAPESPLHATVFYHVPDTPDDKLQVRSLTLGMPDDSTRTTDFGYPGTTQIAATTGIGVTSWRTGIGMGEGEAG